MRVLDAETGEPVWYLPSRCVVMAQTTILGEDDLLVYSYYPETKEFKYSYTFKPDPAQLSLFPTE